MYDRAETARQTFTKHGLTTKPETEKCYNAWLDIKRKCYDPEAREYCRYGAKGRKLSNEWLEDPVEFVNYVLSLPNFEMSKSLDRVDNSKGYEKGNLRWATSKEQARNRGLTNRNTSGVQGVRFREVTGGTYATATWFCIYDGKAKSKTFAVSKFGLLPAFKLACEYRLKMIEELNTQGAGYSEKHGK